jgi:hypothetical protein
MSQDIISNARKVSFSFSGKGKVYKFDFCLISDGNGNEYPWAPIIEIEKTLYQETSVYPHLRNEWTTNGRILDLLASTAIKPEYRMIGPNNAPWVRCAGVVTILCKKDGPACEAFRDQLGEWLESKVAKGAGLDDASARASALHDAGSLQLGGLAALKAINQQFTMMIGTLEQHGQAIEEVRSENKETRAIVDANNRLIQDTFEQGFMITLDFLKEEYPNLATQENSQKFGYFMTKEIKKRGGYKKEDGWYLRDGRRASKLVHWPGTVANKLNKWRVEVQKFFAPAFMQSINAVEKNDVDKNLKWDDIVNGLHLSGITHQLAIHCRMVSMNEDVMILEIPSGADQLRVPAAEAKLESAISEMLGKKIKLIIQMRVCRPRPIDHAQ